MAIKKLRINNAINTKTDALNARTNPLMILDTLGTKRMNRIILNNRNALKAINIEVSGISIKATKSDGIEPATKMKSNTFHTSEKYFLGL